MYSVVVDLVGITIKGIYFYKGWEGYNIKASCKDHTIGY